MRLLVTGSRDWEDAGAVFAALDAHWWASEGTLCVVHGDCKTGADRMARAWCERMKAAGHDVVEERHPAQWKVYQRRAGYVRNAEMAALGADLCLGFLRDNSPGTTMMLALAAERDIRVQLISTSC